MKPIIYLDMDNVLADLNGTAKIWLGDDWYKELDKPGWGRFQDIPGGITPHMNLMPKAVELYEGCCDIVGDKNQVQVLTAMSNRSHQYFPNLPRDKVEWIHKYISKDLRVNFGPFPQHKWLHFNHPMDALVDDQLRNIQQWPGQGVVHVSTEQTLAILWRIFD